MVREGDLQVVVITAFLVRCSLLRILGLLVLFVYRVLHLLHMVIWESTQAENADRVAALVYLGDADVLDNAWHRRLHDVFQSVCNSLKHVRIHETPDNA